MRDVRLNVTTRDGRLASAIGVRDGLIGIAVNRLAAGHEPSIPRSLDSSWENRAAGRHHRADRTAAASLSTVVYGAVRPHVPARIR